MQNRKEEYSEKVISFSVKDFLYLMVQKKIYVSLIVLISVVCSVIYAKFYYKPQYVSCAKIVVISTSDTGNISQNEISISSSLVKDYSELIVDRTVLEEVARELNYPVSYEALKSMVSVNNPELSRILEVYVTSPDPHLSKSIADKICEVGRVKILDILGVDKVNKFSDAYLPAGGTNISFLKSIVLGLFAGVILSMIFVFVCLYFNDKISGEKDIEKYLGICTLGTIPYNRLKQKNGSHSDKKAVKG